MPDDKTTTPPEPPAEPTPEDVEKKYWETLESRLDAWLDKRIEKARTTSTSRTGGRTSLPSILFDAFMGSSKKE